MKRVIALSDSHGDKAALRAAVEQALRVGPVYAAAFLGDGLSDFAAVQPLLMEAGVLCHAVRGNNDWGSREEVAVSFLVNGVRFYACHGHEWHVKYGLERLCYAAMECQAQVALYGHTHHAQVELERGMYLVNPGAVCDRYGVAYADIRVAMPRSMAPTARSAATTTNPTAPISTTTAAPPIRAVCANWCASWARMWDSPSMAMPTA